MIDTKMEFISINIAEFEKIIASLMRGKAKFPKKYTAKRYFQLGGVFEVNFARCIMQR